MGVRAGRAAFATRRVRVAVVPGKASPGVGLDDLTGHDLAPQPALTWVMVLPGRWGAQWTTSPSLDERPETTAARQLSWALPPAGV